MNSIIPKDTKIFWSAEEYLRYCRKCKPKEKHLLVDGISADNIVNQSLSAVEAERVNSVIATFMYEYRIKIVVILLSQIKPIPREVLQGRRRIMKLMMDINKFEVFTLKIGESPFERIVRMLKERSQD